MTDTQLSRRLFLKVTATAAGGALFAFNLSGARAQNATGSGTAMEDAPQVTAFLRIDPDGGIVFLNPFIEMGQGTYTSIPQIVAEELDAPLEAFRVEQAPPGDAYKVFNFGAPLRFTGGSLSVRGSYMTMRKVGAGARAMLLAAAADELGVPVAELRTSDGKVHHDASGRSVGYGALAARAAAQTPPEDPPLKDPSAFKLIGQSPKRTDSLEKSTGRAGFGIDVQVDGMRFAAIRHAPSFGGTVASFDPKSIDGMPGNPRAVDLGSAVAVVADSFWRAKKAVEALGVTWNDGAADISSERLIDAALARLDETGIEAEAEGDAPAAIAGAVQELTADYVQPFLAHATMEPQNCTAWVRDNACEIWAPNQGADFVLGTAQQVTGLPAEAITVHTPYLGGGFGRRFVLDFATQALKLSMADGGPVKLVWTREEDTQNDYYRPMAAVRLRAGLDAGGKPVGLHATTVTEGPAARLMPGLVQPNGLDPTSVEGLVKQPYKVGARRTDMVNAGYDAVPVGFWRSVGGALNAFPYESFIDEMAHAAGQEPLDYRLALLEPGSNEYALLEKVRDMAGYRPGTYTAEGETRAMGVAQHEAFGSLVAQIAEVSVRAGRAHVSRVWAAIDLGSVVNPEIVKAQVTGGAIYGLSAALHEEVVIENGQATRPNFDTYPILTPQEAPEIEVAVVTSDRPMGGVGEPGTAPIAPAVANAIFKLTGTRIRRLPISRHDLGAA
ncbi:Isoquinoline 1-oxidoreductase beta subunit [Rhodovulum sp. P5]|uniref:xanthine dehydrogenase family protein molybdopterin-binding subunit n=1 Tax=Rhodovulum sp. P5 TaxID=1564506 RepID=UPI0009C2C78E|nr:molybdopterin cofactor-binding domain-containing protein [Rhodovulum sp. P5]ARE40751.1 Isoquinoline 1-oxidoreductase beta subunit [Rhodovulum sp. P5]